MKKTEPAEKTDQLNLSEVVDQAAAELLDGKPLDLEALCHGNPHIREQLEAVLPTIQAMADFGELSSSTSQQRSSDRLHSLTDGSVADGLVGTLGDFRILREIGRGGMGIVYEAEQISLGRLVALKVLPFAALLDSRQLQRFKNEARAAAMLKHPGIVSVYSVGCERGVHYYAMERIDGPSLSEVIQRIHGAESPAAESENALLPLTNTARMANAKADTRSLASMKTQYSSNRPAFYRSVAELGIQAAAALDFAHQSDIIHRDIKPSNLLLDSDGQLHVADFGLARIQTGDDLTMSGDTLGTLRYMSPEQLEHGRDVGRRADIYSLGLTLFELIEGQPAFAGANRHEITNDILARTPTFSTPARRNLPHDLETIIAKAIDKDAACRYSTAADMAADLQRFLDEKPITARRTSKLERTRRWTRRNRALATALTAVFLLMLTLATGSTSVAWRLSTEAAKNRSALYARDMRLAQTSLEHGDRLAVEKTLLAWVPQDQSDDLRDFEWFYLWNRCHPAAIERTISHALYAYAVEFASDDGGLLASGWWNPSIDIWDWQNREKSDPTQRLRQEVMGIHELVRLPEKNWLVSGDVDGNVIIWDLVTGEMIETIRLETSENNNHVNSVSVSPNYRYVAVGCGLGENGYAHVWDRSQESWVAKIDGRLGRCLAVFLDDDHLVIVSQESDVLEVWQVGSWTVEAQHELDADGVSAIALSPEQRELAVATISRLDRRTTGRVDIWDVDTWKRKKRRSLRTGRIRSMDYSANGRFLVTGGDDEAMTLTDLESDQVRVLEGMHAGNIYSVALSADGRYLASASHDKQVHVWNTSKLWQTASSSNVPLDTNLRTTQAMRFVNQGNLICGSRPGGDIILWNAHDGRIHDQFKIDCEGSMVQLAVHQEKSLAAITCGYWPPQWGAAGKVVLWDLQRNEFHSEYEISNGILYSESSFSPCGRFLAVCSNNDVVIIDIDACQIHRQLSFGGMVKSVDFSDDGLWLACNNWGRGTIHLVDADGFVERREPIVADTKACSYVAFSPDSKWVAAGGAECRLRLFDVSTGDIVQEFAECPSYIVSIDFSPNGRRIVAASADGQMRVYDTGTGEDLLRFELSHGGYPTTRFSPDGKSLLLADYHAAEVLHADTTNEVARLSVAELKDIACRDLVDAKWVNPKGDN